VDCFRDADEQTLAGHSVERAIAHAIERQVLPRIWYLNGMRSTIDKAGRVVIPASIRDRAGLLPGAALEITLDDGIVRIQRVAAGPKLVKVGRRLVARPTAPVDARPAVDVAALVEEERNRWP
jgi:AbrB family looped-hinge helix DNA binding protein